MTEFGLITRNIFCFRELDHDIEDLLSELREKTLWDLEPLYSDVITGLERGTRNHYFPDNPLKEGRTHPFRLNEERRPVLWSKLDVLFTKHFKLTKDDLEYILNTFPVLEVWERMEKSE